MQERERNHQWLFYADYIVMKKDGTVWVIETKGGESKGKDNRLYINNTEFAIDMAEDHWKPISQVF